MFSNPLSVKLLNIVVLDGKEVNKSGSGEVRKIVSWEVMKRES